MHQFRPLDEEDRKPDYQTNRNCLSRRILFLHTFDTHSMVRNALKSHELTDRDIPTIKDEDDCRFRVDILHKEKGEREEEYTVNEFYGLLYETNKNEMVFVIVFNIFIAISEMAGLVFLQLAIDEAFLPFDRTKIYLWTFAVGFFWLLKAIFSHNLFYESNMISAKSKNVIILMIYEKIAKLSKNVVDGHEIGKIINMISNDFNVVELKVKDLLMTISFPIKLIGYFFLLFYRLGWMCLILFVFIFFIICFQLLLGKFSGHFLKQINVQKDQRIKIYTEIIEGIKVIKLYGWEIAFKQMIQTIREKEIGCFIKHKLVRSFLMITKDCSAYLCAFGCFIIIFYSSQKDKLTPAIFLGTIQVVMEFNESIFSVGNAISMFFSLNVLLDRFVNIMNLRNIRLEQLEGGNIDQKIQLNHAEARLQDFYGYWKRQNQNQGDSKAVLRSINIHFKRKGFYGIMGKVGAGKTSLLLAILEEIPYCRGRIAREGSIAFVEQEPVIFSTTVRQNILFEKPFDRQKYQKALECCCLQEDLQLLENGDETVVGERGTTLSGGQKARLSLARAMYSDSDIYLLDDPLSAVDSKVGRKIYEQICQYLVGKKTVILVTHQTYFLKDCDEVIVMDDGQIKEINQPKMMRMKLEEEKEQQGMLNEEEKPEKLLNYEPNVQVTCGSYPKYIYYHMVNFLVFNFSLIMFFAYEFSIAFIVRIYSMYDQVKKGQNQHFQSFSSFWVTLGLLHVLALCSLIVKIFMLQLSILKSNEKIHDDMVLGLVRSPLSFFDTTSSSQLTNKFSNDLGILDLQVSECFVPIFERLILWFVMMANIIEIDLIYIAPLGVCLISFVLLFNYFKQSIIETKQLSLKLKSPVFHQMRETIGGLIPIQSLGQVKRMMKKFEQLLNISLQGNIACVNLERAFGVCIHYVTLVVLAIAMELGAMRLTGVSGSSFGVQILFINRLSQSTQYLLRLFVTVETLMISAERAFKVAQLPPEKQLYTKYDEQYNIPLPQSLESSSNLWPESASIQVKNLSMKYRPQLPYVLKAVSFSIKDGQKVGIVGRTGAGKSSIIQALFRTVEPEEGWTYRIGGFDATQMGLHSLRMNMSVIPQTPFLFRGTIAQNIDPFERKAKSQLWWSLQTSGLKEYVSSLPIQLETYLSNTSDVFSAGQKQLLCLARALISRNKILLLDEATSNVDKKTDDFIQKCIKTEFKKCTVITIAHRLSTIADYDKIIVLANGRIVEMGSPLQLVKKKGLFEEMVSQAGDEGERIKEMMLK